MSADSDDHRGGTAFTLAAIGSGAALLWLLLRGRAWSWRSGNGRSGGEGSSAARPPPISVMLRDGDRIEVDGVPTNLATAVAKARAAGRVHVRTDGAVRHGFVSEVRSALLGVAVDVASDVDGNDDTVH